MSNEKIVVPKLRFPGFEGNWEEKKLGEITTWASGGTPPKDEPKYWDGDIPWISASSMRGLEYNDSPLQLTEAGVKKGSKIAAKNSLLLLVRGSMLFNKIPIGIVGRDVAFNQDLKSIVVDPESILNKYLLYWFISKESTLMDLVTSTGIGAGKLDLQELKDLNISLPNLTEQQKVISFFTSTDCKIENLKKKKSLVEKYKKGMMQKIFNQEIRFKDENGKDFGDWEEKTLGECLDFEQPTKYLVSSTDYHKDFDTPVVTAGKTFILGYTDETDGIFDKNLPVIIFDDFTTATQFVDFKFKAKSSAMKILKAKENVNIKFIYEAMQFIEYEIGGHGRHWISVFANLEIPLPEIKEQTKIANFLSAIDDKINHVAAQIENMEVWKKGLLGEMFV